MSSPTSRRKFLKLFAFVAASPLAAKLFKPNEALAADQVVALDNPTAVALGYNHNAELVDIKKWSKRAGDEGKKQFCSNCNFLKGEAKKVDGQEGEWVGCQLFPGNLVNNKGWCNSWTAKVKS